LFGSAISCFKLFFICATVARGYVDEFLSVPSVAAVAAFYFYRTSQNYGVDDPAHFNHFNEQSNALSD
jgi:hypothetical protein